MRYLVVLWIIILRILVTWWVGVAIVFDLVGVTGVAIVFDFVDLVGVDGVIGILDLVIGPGESIYSQGNCTKFAFVILFVYNITRILTDVVIDHQASVRAQKLEAELEDSRIAVMLSQIQPHFLYNALTSLICKLMAR